ncbi:hypothetical protein [Burkholderia territorii]|uniref:hypothetical protein n=1 Tax=Burkholderia territorii TaxID=1503055 RepID=UPI0009BF9C1F|nr:hypothetical protein [Burkholderia territorii]
MSAAPVANQTLSNLFYNEPDPVEALSENQGSALFLQAMVWKTGGHPDVTHGRLVALACGHYTVTKALHRAKCRRCGEMIRAGYDYDAFRNLGGRDEFSWPHDPLRSLHEQPTGSAEQKRSPI